MTLGVLASTTLFVHAQTKVIPAPTAASVSNTGDPSYKKEILSAIAKTAGTRPVIFADESIISETLKEHPDKAASVIAEQIRHPLLALNITQEQAEKVVDLFFCSPLILEHYEKTLARGEPFAVKLGHDGKLSAQLIFMPSTHHDLLAPTKADQTFFERYSGIRGLDGDLARRHHLDLGLVMMAFTRFHETQHAQQDLLGKDNEPTYVNEIATGEHELSSSRDELRENESKEVDADLAATKQVFQIWHNAAVLHDIAATRNLGVMAGGEHNSGSDIDTLTNALSGAADDGGALTRDQMRKARHETDLFDALYTHKDVFKNEAVVGPLVDGLLNHNGAYDLDKLMAGYYIAARVALLTASETASTADATSIGTEGQVLSKNQIKLLEMDIRSYQQLAPERARDFDKRIENSLLPPPSRSPSNARGQGYEAPQTH